MTRSEEVVLLIAPDTLERMKLWHIVPHVLGAHSIKCTFTVKVVVLCFPRYCGEYFMFNWTTTWLASTPADWNYWPLLMRCPSLLQLTARSLPAVHSDERLQPLLNHLRWDEGWITWMVLCRTLLKRRFSRIDLWHQKALQACGWSEEIQSVPTDEARCCLSMCCLALRVQHHLFYL